MSQQQNEQRGKIDWKTQIYVLGALLGAVLGFLSAYLFTQEAKDDTQDDKRPDIPPTKMLGLATATLGLVRQIAESARKDNGKK